MKIKYLQPQFRVEKIELPVCFCQSGVPTTGTSIDDLTEEDELYFE